MTKTWDEFEGVWTLETGVLTLQVEDFGRDRGAEWEIWASDTCIAVGIHSEPMGVDAAKAAAVACARRLARGILEALPDAVDPGDVLVAK